MNGWIEKLLISEPFWPPSMCQIDSQSDEPFSCVSGTEGLHVQLPSPRIHEREEEVGIYSSTAQRLPAVGVKICHVK